MAAKEGDELDRELSDASSGFEGEDDDDDDVPATGYEPLPQSSDEVR